MTHTVTDLVVCALALVVGNTIWENYKHTAEAYRLMGFIIVGVFLGLMVRSLHDLGIASIGISVAYGIRAVLDWNEQITKGPIK